MLFRSEYQKMVESGRVPGKGRIRTSIEKLSRRASEQGRICVSTEIWLNPGEYREKVEFVRVSKNCTHEYQIRVESVRIPKNGRIRESTGKRKNPYDYRKTIRVSTGKWSNQCEQRKIVESGQYRKKVESVRLSKNC